MRRMRILIIPGNDEAVMDNLVEFIKKNQTTLQAIKHRLFIIGVKNLVEHIGKKIPKKFLKERIVVLYRINKDKDLGSQVLKIFIDVNPDIILFFKRRKIDEDNCSMISFYHLATSRKGIKIISYIDSSNVSEYVRVGEHIQSPTDLIRIFEED